MLRSLESLKKRFPRRSESGVFAKSLQPAGRALGPCRNFPPSQRPQFELVTQPEKPFLSAFSPSCSGSDARSRSACSARLCLRKRSNAPLRAFESERQGFAPPPVPCMAPLARPFAQDCELSIPLERLRLETRRLALTRWRSLDEFQNPPLHSAFWSGR